eukprot:3728585-Amphidinium_carterae.1
MCSFYQKGRCSRGKQCVFAHSCAELLPAPDFKRTRLCMRVRLGGLCEEPGCEFAHSMQELRHRKSTAAEIAVQKSQAAMKNDEVCSIATSSQQSTADLEREFGGSLSASSRNSTRS